MRYGATPLAWLACFLFWLAIWDFSRRFLKSTWSKIGIPLIVVAILIAATVILLRLSSDNKPGPEPQPQPRFSVVVKGGVISPVKERSIFWMVTSVSGKPILSPVAAMAYVHFTNLSKSPFSIDGYTIEFEVKPGNWKAEPLLDVRHSELFNVENFNFKKAFVLDFSNNRFDALVEHKLIDANETVEGWLFFECWEPSTAWRMRVRDATGSESVQMILNAPFTMGMNFGAGSIHVTGQRKDISGATFDPRVDLTQLPK